MCSAEHPAYAGQSALGQPGNAHRCHNPQGHDGEHLSPFGERWSAMTDGRPERFPLCDETCTVDCGTCKGKPVQALRKRLIRALAFSRDAHGGVPWDEKPRWRDGYDIAANTVRDILEGRRP